MDGIAPSPDCAQEGPADGRLMRESVSRPAVFREIFDRHHRAVWGFLARRYGRSVAEEITAATFAEAFAARDRFDPTRVDARPWLFGTALNLARAHWRREQAQLQVLARGGIGYEAPVEQGLDRTSLLAKALASLDTADRETLLLFALADLSYSEIAEVTGVPEGTVRSRLHRARRIVKEAIDE
jgi:RNA polymerase sigma-70 factor (ECF subfamily)